MLITQTVEIRGKDIVLVLTDPSGRVLAQRTWEGAGRFAFVLDRSLVVKVPMRVALDLPVQLEGD